MAMAEDRDAEAIKEAHETSQLARRRADEHRRAQDVGDPQDAAAARRGEQLTQAAVDASAKLTFLKQQARAAAGVKRREQAIADDAARQPQLRAEAQARRDAAAAAPPRPTRGRR